MDKPVQFELVLDILEGCRWSCSGCTVKELGAGAADLSNALEFIGQLPPNYILNHLELGPTDVTVAKNARSVLSSPIFRELAGLFETVFLTASLLDNTLVDPLIEIIGTMSGKVSLFVPIEFKHLNNLHYVNLVDSRLNYVMSKTGCSAYYALSISDLSDIAEALLESQLSLLVSTTGKLIGYNNPALRAAAGGGNNVEQLLSLSVFIDSQIRATKSNFKDVGPVGHKEGICFNSGNIYVMPYMQHLTPNTLDTFKVKTFNEYRALMLEGNARVFSDSDICATCQDFNSCTVRFTPLLTNSLKLTSCPIKE